MTLHKEKLKRSASVNINNIFESQMLAFIIEVIFFLQFSFLFIKSLKATAILKPTENT